MEKKGPKSNTDAIYRSEPRPSRSAIKMESFWGRCQCGVGVLKKKKKQLRVSELPSKVLLSHGGIEIRYHSPIPIPFLSQSLFFAVRFLLYISFALEVVKWVGGGGGVGGDWGGCLDRWRRRGCGGACSGPFSPSSNGGRSMSQWLLPTSGSFRFVSIVFFLLGFGFFLFSFLAVRGCLNYRVSSLNLLLFVKGCCFCLDLVVGLIFFYAFLMMCDIYVNWLLSFFLLKKI